MSRARVPAWPRLLTREQAAHYCGVAAGTFDAHCPVKAVSLGNGKRLDRFDIEKLDAWIDKLGCDGQSSTMDWLAMVEKHGNRRAG